MSDLHSAMQAILSSANLPGPGHKNRPSKPVITISREHGALGRQVAEALGQRLDLPVYDWIILNRIAEKLDTDPETVRMLDESVARMRDMWLVRLFTGRDLSADTYRTHLVNVILSLARVGGIILGRGANVVLATSCAVRVRMVGSLDVCARRIVVREKLSFDEARKECDRINDNRGRFLKEMFDRQQSDPTNYDLVINTDRLQDSQNIVDMILSAYEGLSKGEMP